MTDKQKRSRRQSFAIGVLLALFVFCVYMALTVKPDPANEQFPSYVPGEVIEPTPTPTVGDKVREAIGRSTPTPTPPPINEETIVIGDVIIDNINAIRKSQGKRQLIIEPKLVAGAQKRAQDLVAKNQWSHENFAEAFVEAGITQSGVGENLAKDIPNGAVVVQRWLGSPAHAAVMLDPRYKYVGVGRHQNYVVFWASVRNY